MARAPQDPPARRPAALPAPGAARAGTQRRIEVGGWRITALSDGFFRLDGGAMWGVVPASLWRAWTPPDADNTLRLALRPFLAERGADKVVIEAGLGERWDAKQRARFRMEREETLAASLARAGLEPGDVTHVVLSHCHWDHAGGATVARGGELVPLFGRARHFAPADEIAAAKAPGPARAASYRADDVLALERAGVLVGYGADGGARCELLPGLVAHVLGGHSDGVAVVTVGEPDADRPGSAAAPARGACAVFWSDVVPTTHHVQPGYITAYDQDVVRSYAVRAEWIARAADRGFAGLFYHDEQRAFARIVRDGKRFASVPLEPGAA